MRSKCSDQIILLPTQFGRTNHSSQLTMDWKHSKFPNTSPGQPWAQSCLKDHHFSLGKCFYPALCADCWSMMNVTWHYRNYFPLTLCLTLLLHLKTKAEGRRNSHHSFWDKPWSWVSTRRSCFQVGRPAWLSANTQHRGTTRCGFCAWRKKCSLKLLSCS